VSADQRESGLELVIAAFEWLDVAPPANNPDVHSYPYRAIRHAVLRREHRAQRQEGGRIRRSYDLSN